MRRLLLAVPLFVLTPLAACSSEQPSSVRLARDLQPISGGTSDTTHHAVVMVVHTDGQYIAGLCSGTLIAPNLVLTARHCVAPTSGGYVQCGQSPFGTPYSGQSMYISTDPTISQNGNWFPGAEVRVPSDGNDTCGFDVALITLAQNVPGNIAVPHIPRIDRPARATEPYTAVGYGLSSSSNQNSSGRRRIRTGLKVRCSAATVGACPYGVSFSEFLGDTGICEGDSGGPALDAQEYVIGVVSRGSEPCSSPVYGDVSSWKDFIISAAKDAAQRGGYQPADWVTTGVTDPTMPGSGGSGSGGAGGSGGSAGSGATGSGGNPGSGGSNNPFPSGGQGVSCSGSDQCLPGYQCVTQSTPDQGYCGAPCDVSGGCGEGLLCNTDINICMNQSAFATQSSSKSGCSIDGRGPAKPVPWIIGAGLFVFGVLRRRRSA